MDESLAADRYARPRAAAGLGIRPAVGSRPITLRALLALGCMVSGGIAVRICDPAPYLQADPGLARLLRGMASIKALIVLGALSAVLWRFGGRVTRPVAAAYLASSIAMVGSTTLIWELTLIPPAAIVFHAALLTMLVAAWRDDRPWIR